MRQPRSSEEGIALVAVLWVISILSLIATAILTSTSFSYRMSRNAWSHVEAQAAADAAISRGILGMLDKRPDLRWRIDGTTYNFAFGEWQARIRIEDEFGKIDINEADGALLKRLFVASDVPDEAASALANRILDWRKQVSLQRPTATQTAPDAQRHYRLRNGPFQSLDEMKLVVGMTPGLFERLRPAITVYSGRPLIDTATASKTVLMAYLGIDEENAAKEVARRASSAANAGGGLARNDKLDPALQTFGHAFSIEANVARDNLHETRRAVVLLTGDADRPYLVFDWQ